MFCTKCGNQVKDGTLFCTQCGAPCGVGDVVSTSDKQSERIHADQEKEESKDDDDYPEFGFKTNLALALLAYIIAAGVLVLILKFSEGYWSMLILGVILATALSCAGAMLVNALIVPCVPSTVPLTATCRKVLRFFATLIISIPFLFPAYGMVMGLIEVYFTERVRENGSTKIKMVSYVKNYPKMNAFSRLGYKRIYRISVEDKKFLGALESSMDAASSLLGEGNGKAESAGVDGSAEAGGLKTFVGVTFGTKPTADKFEDIMAEAGQYIFKPTHELGAYRVAYAELDTGTKLINAITLAQWFENDNEAEKFFEFADKNVKRHYSKAGIIEQRQGSVFWNDLEKREATGGMNYKKLRAYAVLDDNGVVKQYISVGKHIETNGSPAVFVSAKDMTVGKR